jgi:hypothetical protein
MLYHFAETIGPVANRKPQCDPFSGKMDATTLGLDEFLRYAEKVGSEITLVAPWFESTPEEIAAMVAYVKGDPKSTDRIGDGPDENGKDWKTVGYWASLRETNGHHAYTGAKYLEIGNEQWGDFGVGPDDNCAGPGKFFPNRRKTATGYVPTTAEDYATRAVRISRLAKRVDPTIQIGVAAMTEINFENKDVLALHALTDREQKTGNAWNPTIDRIAHDDFDFFIVHEYRLYPRFRLRLADDMERVASQLKTLDPSKRIGVTEYGFFYSGETLLNAIVTADMLRVGLEQDFEMLLRHILVEDDSTGLFANSAAIFAGKDKVTTTPGYTVMKLLANGLKEKGFPVTGQTDDVKAIFTESADGHAAIALIGRADRANENIDVALNLSSGEWKGTMKSYYGTLSSTAEDLKYAEKNVKMDRDGKLHVTISSQSVNLLELTPTFL